MVSSGAYKSSKRIRYLFLIVFCLGCTYTHSQGLGFDLGYKYQTSNLGYAGLSFAKSWGRPYDSVGNTTLFCAGGGTYLGSINGSTKVIPAAYASLGFGGVMLIDSKVTASQHFINPSVGINAINFMKIDVGYSIPLKEINGIKMQGFTVAVTFSLGSSKYYVDLSN